MAKKYGTVAIILLVSLSAQAVEPSPFCKPLLKPKVSSSRSTQNFTAYLSELLNLRVIGPSSLEKILKSLNESSTVANPIDENLARLDTNLDIHFKNLNKHIRNKNLNIAELESWLVLKIAQGNEDANRQEEVETKTESIARPLKFITLINPKAGQPGEGPSIEVMDTHVTQYQWFQIMKENSSVNVHSESDFFVESEKGPVKINPNHPAENFSILSAIMFANALSRAHGYQEVYNLEELENIFSGSAGYGTLFTDYFSKKPLDKIKINAREGDILKAEGYRLMVEEDLDLMIRKLTDAPESSDQHPAARLRADRLERFSKYEWHSGNSNFSTQPVASLTPWQMDGQAIYDIAGNVETMIFDPRKTRTFNNDGPQKFVASTSGGGFEKALLGEPFHIDELKWFSSAGRSSGLGLRLVRNLTSAEKPPEGQK